MAAGDGHIFNNFKEQLLLGTIDCNTDVFKLALYSDAYSAAQLDGADTAYAATNEISGSGYTAGGESIGTPVVAQDDTNDRASWDDDGTDVMWTALAANTILRALLYDDTTTPNITYIGKARAGTAEDSADWQIKVVDETTAVVMVLFADGDENFDNSWEDRININYS